MTRDREPAPVSDDTVNPAQQARGPHLPDVVTRTWAAWIFVILAIGYIAWYVTHLDVKPAASLADFVVYVLQAVPSATAILLPAAVLARHPDAWSHARTLLFGTILYAAVQGLLILADPLQGFFETQTPASPDLPFLVPLATAYSALISLVAAFGLGYIAVGLSVARRYEGGSRWTTGWFVPVATVFGTVVGVLAVSRIPFGDTPMSPTLIIYLASSVVLGVLRIVMWAWLASVATRGWLAGEDPRSGWGLASIATAFVLLALALVNLSQLIDVPNNAIGTGLGYVIVILYAGGHLALLAAFAVGLPAIDEVDDTDLDDDFDDDALDDDDFDDDDEEDADSAG